MKSENFVDVLFAITKFGAINVDDLSSFTCLDLTTLAGVNLKLTSIGLITHFPVDGRAIIMPTVEGLQWVKLYLELKEPKEPEQIELPENVREYAK